MTSVLMTIVWLSCLLCLVTTSDYEAQILQTAIAATFLIWLFEKQ